MSAYSTDYAQLSDRYDARQQVMRVAQEDPESLKRDLDMIRTERENALQQVQQPAAAQRQAKADKLNGFIRSLPLLLSIATRLRSFQFTPPAFTNAVRSAVLASFELPPSGSPQFLALVPVILADVVLTSPQMPDLDDPDGVLRQAVTVASPVAVPEAPTDAPNISFAVPAPVPEPRAAAPLWAPGAPLRPPSRTPSPTDAALASLMEWNPRIPRGCEAEVAHAFHLQLFRQYGASVSFLPQSPILEQWTWVRSHALSLPGIAEVLRTFLASPPPVQQIVDSPAASPAEAEAANQAEGAAKKKGSTPQKVDLQLTAGPRPPPTWAPAPCRA